MSKTDLTTGQKTIAIVLPVYKPIEDIDMPALHTLAERCPGIIPVIVITPDKRGMDDLFERVSYIIHDISPELEVKHMTFPKKYFASTKAYSDMMKSSMFWSKVDEYKYILTYQLDCLALDLSYIWSILEDSWDFVGAPIISNKKDWPHCPCTGNGGFSLRNTSLFSAMAADDKTKTEVEAKGQRFIDYEDVFYIDGMAEHYWIDVPVWDDAAAFAFDMNPDVLYNRLKRFPIVGIHAWQKNWPFWKKHLDKLPISASTKSMMLRCEEDILQKHGEFISQYYKS